MKELNSTSEFVVWHYFLYDGSVSDILINYILLIIYSLALLWPCGGCLQPRAIFTLLHTGLCVGLQVGCWVLADAYGISLIWCGQMGQLSIIILEMVKLDRPIRESFIKCAFADLEETFFEGDVWKAS